jgi:hypothetical protein
MYLQVFLSKRACLPQRLLVPLQAGLPIPPSGQQIPDSVEFYNRDAKIPIIGRPNKK